MVNLKYSTSMVSVCWPQRNYLTLKIKYLHVLRARSVGAQDSDHHSLPFESLLNQNSRKPVLFEKRNFRFFKNFILPFHGEVNLITYSNKIKNISSLKQGYNSSSN